MYNKHKSSRVYDKKRKDVNSFIINYSHVLPMFIVLNSN